MKNKNQKIIGFALETNNELENAKSKLVRKKLDAIVMNSLNQRVQVLILIQIKLHLLLKLNQLNLASNLKMKFQKKYLMKFLIYNILLFLSFYKSFSQELNAEVVVNSNLVNQTDKQVFNDFQSSVYQFLNSNRFSSDSYSLIQKNRL